jgi:hypothetical protein
VTGKLLGDIPARLKTCSGQREGHRCTISD